jgi:2',3'-cyclic-nucleotide 2'-phosphodiesterase (5'-nucleotidase family)
MRRRTVLLLLATSLLIPASAPVQAARAPLQALPWSTTGPQGEHEPAARILVSSALLGAVEPCSCPDNPLGGAAQLAGAVEATRRDGVPVFWFDAGDRLFDQHVAVPDVEDAQRRLRALLLVDVANVTRQDAAGIGHLDLAAGVRWLLQLAERSQSPLLSANLVDDAGGLFFPPDTILRRDGVVLGVTAVLPSGLAGPGWHTTDPFAAAARQVRGLRRRGAELVIVLSNLGREGDRRLARRTKPDLIFGSRERSLDAEPERWGRTLRLESGSRGRYLAEARWYRRGRRPGPALVGTVRPIGKDGPVPARAAELVRQWEERAQDPTLGAPLVLPSGLTP